MNREQSLTAALKQSGMPEKVWPEGEEQEQEQEGEQEQEQQQLCEQEAELEEQPWPELVQLHQPAKHTEMLLAEHTTCLAVRTYLRLCRLPFAVRTSVHAEYMTQDGHLTGLPLLRLGECSCSLLCEFQPIVAYVEDTRPSNVLSRWLPMELREDMRCLVNYVEVVFTLVEIHLSYLDAVNYRLYTAKRTAVGYPWLLGLARRYYKQQRALRLLRVYQWHNLDADQVLDEVSRCCEALVARLEEQGSQESYLCGKRPCELDALVFGHVAGILTTPLPNRELAELLYTYPRLVSHCRRIDAMLYGGKLLAGNDDAAEEDYVVGERVEEEEEQEEEQERGKELEQEQEQELQRRAQK